MNYYGYELIRESDLTHHGIKGQKWGERRFQNEDGTWTEAGKARYGDDNGGGSARSFRGNVNRALAKVYGANEKYYSKHGNKTMANANANAKNKLLKKAEEADKAKNTPEAKAKAEKLKKAAKIGAAVAGTALVAYGAYKVYSTNKAKSDLLKMDAQREQMNKRVEAAKRLYDTHLRESMNSSISGTFSMRLPDGNMVSTSWDNRRK